MEDDRYRQVRAEMGVVFPMSLRSKMLLTIGTLLISVLAAPAEYLNRDSIRALEGTGALPETLSMWAGVLILLGNLNTFVVGVYMLRYVRARTMETSLPDRETIERRLRIEDFVTWFQVWGTLAAFAPLLLLVIALVPGVADWLYDAGITIYRPFETVTLDIRLIAGVSGGGLGVLLWAMWWLVR